MKTKAANRAVSERKLIFLIGAIQFINIVDFMMVMPMGPDFAPALGIDTSQLGWVGGSYGLAAAISGIVTSFFLDRFDRRKALFFAMLGLAVGTLCGGLATNMWTLIAARVLAGAFGGPASALSFSIIADGIPAERRGKAFGAAMGAFSAASVLGVPAGLELARLGGWRLPFFGISAVCLLITFSALSLMPPMIGHLKTRAPAGAVAGTLRLFRRPEVLLSYLATTAGMFSSFLLIPNFSAFFQYNLHFPRERLGLLYMLGGTLSFFAMRAVGRLIDRTSNTYVSFLACGLVAATLVFGYTLSPPALPVTLIFAMTMLGFSSRNVTLNSLASRIPEASDRARFHALQSSISHIAGAAGAFLATRILRQDGTGALIGVPTLAEMALGLTVAVPFLVLKVESRVRVRERSASPTLPQEA